MNIAIVGSGVAAMVAAYHLHRADHRITVFEARDRVGGHTHTHRVEEGGSNGAGMLAIDSGFIVFNPASYPNFVTLLESLGVRSQPTCMSLSVVDPDRGIAWSSLRPFPRWRDLSRWPVWSMLRHMGRFHAAARRLLDTADESLTVDAFCRQARLNDHFVRLYLKPMGAAIWSSPVDGFGEFPALFLVQFMHNHQMLQIGGRPEWRTVEGGSARYMDALAEPLTSRIRLGEPVRAVRRVASGVRIDTERQADQAFDAVVLGCHSDQSLAVLADATDGERRMLGAIPYQKNRAVLHTDTTHLPSTPQAWASWNVTLPDRSSGPAPLSVTYWMNRLQSLEARDNYCLTLNPTRPIASERIISEMDYMHPVFTSGRQAAHDQLKCSQGQRHTWFCGAWCGWGFHEDAVRSGLRVAAGLDCAVTVREVAHAP